MLAERVIEWTQDWKQQGYDSGFGEGFGEGFDKGEAALLERQLRKRFGPLDADTEARLQAASSAEIERWAERIFDAPDIPPPNASKVSYFPSAFIQRYWAG